MRVYVLDFSPPMEGLDTKGKFNTFRLGRKWSERLRRGTSVMLLDRKKDVIFGRAKVLSVHKGPLREMADQHAHKNHNQMRTPKWAAASSLMDNMIQRYGPHIATDTKLCCVIYLRRTL